MVMSFLVLLVPALPLPVLGSLNGPRRLGLCLAFGLSLGIVFLIGVDWALIFAFLVATGDLGVRISTLDDESEDDLPEVDTKDELIDLDDAKENYIQE